MSTAKASNTESVKKNPPKSPKPAPSASTNPPSDSTPAKVANFVWIGVVVTLADYLIYLLILFLVFQGNPDRISLSTTLSALVATLIAYFLHSHITWRARDPGRLGIVKFFLWNLTLALAVRPLLSWLMGLLTVVYDFAFGLSQWLHLPFTHDFITSTGIFGFITVITMVINYFVYDTLVFDSPRKLIRKKSKKSAPSARKSPESPQKSPPEPKS